MEWDEPLEEAEDEEGFAGALDQYAGQTVRLWREQDVFALRWEDDLLGRLSRPGEHMLAEAREGRWEIRRPRRSIAQIELVDGGGVFGRYRRRAFRSAAITTQTSVYRLHHRTAHPEWTLTDGARGKLLELRPAQGVAVLDVKVLGVPGVGSDLGPLALLCSYVLLMNSASTAGSGSGPDALPF
jgi:hypothetical protein